MRTAVTFLTRVAKISIRHSLRTTVHEKRDEDLFVVDSKGDDKSAYSTVCAYVKALIQGSLSSEAAAQTLYTSAYGPQNSLATVRSARRLCSWCCPIKEDALNTERKGPTAPSGQEKSQRSIQ